MRRFAAGDGEAFARIFERHHTAVYHFARAMVGDDAAQDVLQEAFLAAARSAGGYQPRGCFRPWLLKIVRNLCLNWTEARQARRVVRGHEWHDELDVPAARPTPLQSAEAAERLALVEQAMAALPGPQREAVVLFATEDLSYQQIADVLDVPINTVKTLIHRGRAALAQERYRDVASF